MNFTEIKISGLKAGSHTFRFELGDGFLAGFSSDFFDHPIINLQVILEISETMIKADLYLKGDVELICDRSLESFRFPIELTEVHYFKFGEEEEELSDELEVISKERISIDFDQLTYDLIALSLPSKKLHPRYQEDDEDEIEGRLIFSTHIVDEKESVEPDPRWTKLKEINI